MGAIVSKPPQGNSQKKDNSKDNNVASKNDTKANVQKTKTYEEQPKYIPEKQQNPSTTSSSSNPPVNNIIQKQEISNTNNNNINNVPQNNDIEEMDNNKPIVDFKDDIPTEDEFDGVEEYNDGEQGEPAFQMDEHISACMCPVFVVDTKTNIHSMNSFGEELFGKSLKDLQSKNVCLILNENSAGELQKRIRDYLQLRSKSMLAEKVVYDIKDPKTPIKKVGVRITEMIKNGLPFFICYLQPEGMQKGSNFEDVLKNQNAAAADDNEDDDEDGDGNSQASMDRKSLIGEENNEGNNTAEEGEVQQQSFQFHSAVTQLSTIPIVAIDTLSIVNTWNPAAEHVFGIRASEIIGNSLTVIMPDEIAINHNAFVNRYIKTGIKRVVDKTRVVNGKRKSGEIFPVELKITEIKDDKDQRIFLGFARDMTAVITKTEQYKHLAEQIFPASIASRVVNGDLIHDFHDQATIMFSDIENFNQLSMEISPKNLISFLDSIFEKFDVTIQKYQLEKIKTIGDNCKYFNSIGF